MNYLIICTVLLLLFILALWLILKSRNMHLWITSYIKLKLSRKIDLNNKIRHIYVCLADHHEPFFQNATVEEAHERVKKWVEGYRSVAYKHTDSDGRHPQHSYFYPEEEYDEWVLNQIKDICNEGLGDVDIHLHHDNDTAENLEKTLINFNKILVNKHNLLRKNEDGQIVYGFIHGNWALDNSRPDGRWCGIDNELDVLIKTGCEFDMTMPSAPSDTQTSTINSIYIAKEDGKCKSHDTGRLLKVGDWKADDELLMIQGPLTLNWRSRKFGLIPRIESSELSNDAPPTKHRIDLWESCGISVQGAENHIFIKLHTHGLQDWNIDMFFRHGGFDTLWTALENKYKNNNRYQLHYVTAWEMYSKIKQIAKGETI